ncbi:MAG: FAD-binding oxidoreductase [Thermoguttaceae bacterium]|jgi:glycolate oxidase FAD binding subunit|nr:FAD-binding oxidoreductase [Thermoguttaceae bacterium]
MLPLSETVTPADRNELADRVRRAAEQGQPVYPLGGGTNLAYGAAPSEPGLGLSLAGLERLVDYPARDLTITVEAGMTLATLAEHLAAEGQQLPVDVPYPDRATVGGAVATGAGGPRQYRWGTLRDYVIGLSAVDGCGTLFSAGGRVVKNAAGYDLCRLLTGSLGSLAVIVQVTLMVKPRPQCSALAACPIPDWDTAEHLLAGLVRTQTLPSAIELLAGPAWRDAPSLGPLPAGAVAWLAVGFEGTDAEVRWMLARLRAEWGETGATVAATLLDRQADPLWKALTEFRQPGPERIADGSCAAEIRVLPGHVVETVRRVLKIDGIASILAHAGNGVVLAHIPAAAVAGLRSAFRASGGSLVVASAPAGTTRDVATVWGPPPGGWTVMQALKCRFDPKGILNRGRFLVADGCR